MTTPTLIEAAQAVVEFLPKHYLPALLGIAMSELKQAIESEKARQEQTPKILMVGANGHFKELSYEVAHDGNFLVHPSNFAQEQERASQSANTNPVVSQKTVETVNKICATCKHHPQSIWDRSMPECFVCKTYSNWEPKP